VEGRRGKIHVCWVGSAQRMVAGTNNVLWKRYLQCASPFNSFSWARHFCKYPISNYVSLAMAGFSSIFGIEGRLAARDPVGSSWFR
jgi:hypothetical protein